MPQKNLSTPSRFAHSRSLSPCPLFQSLRYVKSCGLKVIRRLCPFHPVSICAYHANSDKRRRSCAFSRLPYATRLEVTLPSRFGLSSSSACLSPCLPAGVMGLQAPGKVRYLFTRVPQFPTISLGGGYFSAEGADRAWCGRRVRSASDRRRCRLAARSVAGRR